MSALTARVPLADYDPIRDKTYRDTAMGRDVVDFLAWLELGGAAVRTLDSYERDLARGCLMFPSKGMADLGSSAYVADACRSILEGVGLC